MPEKPENAQLVFTPAKKNRGAGAAEQGNAERKSPSAVAPSRIQPMQMRLSALIALAIAQPTACGYWVPRLPEIEKNPCFLSEYMIGSWRPFTGSPLFE